MHMMLLPALLIECAEWDAETECLLFRSLRSRNADNIFQFTWLQLNSNSVSARKSVSMRERVKGKFSLSLTIYLSHTLSLSYSHLLADSLHCEISSRACAKAHNHAGTNIVIDSLHVRTDK